MVLLTNLFFFLIRFCNKVSVSFFLPRHLCSELVIFVYTAVVHIYPLFSSFRVGLFLYQYFLSNFSSLIPILINCDFHTELPHLHVSYSSFPRRTTGIRFELSCSMAQKNERSSSLSPQNPTVWVARPPPLSAINELRHTHPHAFGISYLLHSRACPPNTRYFVPAHRSFIPISPISLSYSVIAFITAAAAIAVAVPWLTIPQGSQASVFPVLQVELYFMTHSSPESRQIIHPTTVQGEPISSRLSQNPVVRPSNLNWDPDEMINRLIIRLGCGMCRV